VKGEGVEMNKPREVGRVRAREEIIEGLGKSGG